MRAIAVLWECSPLWRRLGEYAFRPILVPHLG